MISIIIPTYNEVSRIGKIVNYLLTEQDEPSEIIVSDGGSTDKTLEAAKTAGATAVISPVKGRAPQMNYGASIAKGDVLYFVHADTTPPASFAQDINNAIQQGYSLGRYRTKFDSNSYLLNINAFFTRFDFFICYGGDQTLFITKYLFDKIGGFNDKMMIMEDYDVVKRARKLGRYKIFNKAALVSARKYDTNSWFKVLLANKKIVQMYKTGASQNDMVKKYRELLAYQ